MIESQKDKEAEYISLYCQAEWGAFNIKIKKSDKVSVLKDKISEETGVDVHNLKLYRHTQLREDTLLDDNLTIEEREFCCIGGSSVKILMRF